jgi:predicted tellurium resistance membrane protein TerC
MATVVTLLLEISYLLIGSALLLWIAIKLLGSRREGGDGASIGNLWQAIRTIVIADFVMSLDNVIGIAAAAKGSVLLLTLGADDQHSADRLQQYPDSAVHGALPWIITLGGALLGYIAGEMAVTDRAVTGWIADHAPVLHTVGPILGIVFVVAVGKVLAARTARPV